EDIDWEKVKITDEVMEYVIPNKYKKCNWREDNSWSDIILKDIYNTFYNDEAKAIEESKLAKESEDMALSIMKCSGKGNTNLKKANADLVDAIDLQNRIKKLSDDFNRFVKAGYILHTITMLAEVVEVSNDAEDSRDLVFFGDEDLILLSNVKYPLTDAEIRIFKEKSTTSTTTTSTDLIASTFNAQAAAPRGYNKINMTGCVLCLRAPNDPNAPPPSTIRKRKP
ncbi:hypothetical protein Tco_0023270, partial [Tanacetum coccineum]